MEEASVSIRLNPFKGLDGPAGTPVPWSPYGRILSERPVFTLDPLFHAGCYYVQDSSAMYVGHLFRKLISNNTKRVLDLCAAPGGKTTDLAASLREVCGDDFVLVANEVMKARVGVLDDNVARWGDPNVVVTSVDPAAFAQLRGYFDIIVADVPCSGEGMFRKDPRAREEWSPAVVDLCAARQKRILADVWPALREGGWLLYSTCTYESAENDENLAWAEGQWAGALRKTAPQPAAKKADLAVLHPLRPGGVRKGEMKGKDLVPDADYALSILFDRNDYRCVDVDRQTALRFLHRDALVLPQAAPGYNAVTYMGHPLGFVKNIGNRCNNLLPKDRRILMNV